MLGDVTPHSVYLPLSCHLLAEGLSAFLTRSLPVEEPTVKSRKGSVVISGTDVLFALDDGQSAVTASVLTLASTLNRHSAAIVASDESLRATASQLSSLVVESASDGAEYVI